ncbi:MAG: alpha/beta fold hydrolase [Gaiellaceae bacterium MAG52_C11]|nr:alpha/beta fold hydrolase [Candidatus Gaiellasilicea maunaloa]
MNDNRKYVAELLGTFTLVFGGSLAILSAVRLEEPILVPVALGFGLALLAGLYAFGEVSGGHYNPAVSLAMFLSGRLESRDLLGYWIAQLVGGVLASLAVLAAFSRDDVAGTVTAVGAGSSAWDALWLEVLLTAIFVAVILHSSRSERVQGTALLAIPLALVAVHLAAISISGASVNPARSFGPALVGGEWGDFWVYAIGPLAGGAIGAAVHGFLYPQTPSRSPRSRSSKWSADGRVRVRRTRRALLLAATLALLLYAGVSWLFSERLIAPTSRPLGAVDARAFGLPQPETTTIAGDGVTLASWYFENPRRSGCAVVMLHGFGGGRAEVIAPTPIFWRRGCHLLLYDARGHGESSPALLSFGAHERQDLRLAIEWLADRTGLPRSRIGLIGWSYGAATAIQAASELSEIAFVVADSSFSSLGDIARVQAEEQFGAWARIFVPGALLVSGLRAGFDARDAAPVDAIRAVRAPVLLVHSRQDGFTPVGHSELIYARANRARTRLVIPDWEAGHARSYTEAPLAYTAVVDRFLAELVPEFGGPRRER